VKSSQRLDYSTLAQVLGQRGLAEPGELTAALQASVKEMVPFPEMLVSENLITDWGLSQVVCDLYNLPFLPVSFYDPSPEASEGLDPEFLRVHRLVPLERCGQILTVAMPGLVTAEVLGMLAAESDLQILPVVGTVLTNIKWLEEQLKRDAPSPLGLARNRGAGLALAAPSGAGDGSLEMLSSGELLGTPEGWANVFDAGDAAVLLDLKPSDLPPQQDP
jgi:hypothetical protein